MTKNKALQIAKQYAYIVRRDFDKDAEIYLFGSAARDEMHNNSDIDIAVISKEFTSDICNNYAEIALFVPNVSWDIEPHPVFIEDMQKTTPFTSDILKDGVKL